MRNLILAVAAFAISLPIAAQAVELANVSGAVLVNRGEGFRSVGTGAQIMPGDRVMAGGDGSAQIVYAEGCLVNVEPGQVVVIRPVADVCAQPAGLSNEVLIGGGLLVAGGVGIAIAAGGGGDDDRPASP